MKKVRTAVDLMDIRLGQQFSFDGDTYTFLRICRTIGNNCIVNTSSHLTDNVLQINIPVKEISTRPWGSGTHLRDPNMDRRRTMAQG